MTLRSIASLWSDGRLAIAFLLPDVPVPMETRSQQAERLSMLELPLGRGGMCIFRAPWNFVGVRVSA